MGIETMKKIDSYMGNIICLALIILDKLKPKKQVNATDKILIIKFWGFGNILLSMPLIRAVKEKYPECEISFLTLYENKGILEVMPHIKKAIYIHKNKTISSFFSTLSEIRKQKYDIVIDLEQFLRLSTILCYLSGTKTRIGFRKENDIRHLLYTKSVTYNNSQHVAKTFCNLAEAIDAEIKSLEPLQLKINNKDKQVVEDFLKENKITENDILIGIHMGTGENSGEVRRWSKDNFAKLSELLAKDARIIFTGTESERMVIEKIINLMSTNVINAAGKFNLPQLAYLLKKCSLFISSDTGPLHLASAMKTRTISFYGPNTPKLYGPLWGNNKVFYKNLACSPCITNYNLKSTGCKDPVCISSITVDEVYESIDLKAIKNKQQTNDRARESEVFMADN